MSTSGFPMNKVEALTMLYLQNQDLKNITIEELLGNEPLVPFVSPYMCSFKPICALDNPLLQFIQGKEIVSILRTVFASKLFHPIVDVYRYTRTYEQGLVTAEYLMSNLGDHTSQITKDEWDEWMAHFFYLQLEMLDYLDQWEDYVACYTQVKHAFTEGQLNTYYNYLLSPNRCELIQRKLQKKQQGRKLGNLLRHQQERLSQEEINYRFERVMDLLKQSYLSENGSLWL